VKLVCTCSVCRRAIRDQIEGVFEREPRWMGEDEIRSLAWLSWVPDPLYRHILGRMALLGIVFKSNSPDEPVPVYLLARCMVPVKVLAEAVEGGQG
jgi:hypothetical protein